MSRIYVDMDGCLAKWDSFDKPFAEFTSVGFYENLEAQRNLLEALNSVIDRVYIISHYVDGYPSAIREKKMWLQRHMPNLKRSHIYIIEKSKNKPEVVSKMSKNDILIDDYNQNLRTWENAGGTAIKFVNRLNDKHRSWKGKRIYYNYSVRKILNKLEVN